ncbi:hypothetical protein [Myxococcus landrumensis]|uniref:Uncharacterized protein n=1 Tax=Myxococcus landrumensis TaxID=2813577 RepID=A0ABX7NHK0_9BACT|nr:hypothetical protein [Myxococcus landrumus]QSQ17065.1 hypothetical protein JY572_13830 [Myxococcus landrumus]
MPAERDFPDEHWAARLGRVGPSLWQLETLQKYGYYAPRGGPESIAVQAGYDFLQNPTLGGFFAGWNYVLASEPSARRRFQEAASLLEGARVLQLSQEQDLLCLRTPIRFERPRLEWKLEEGRSDATGAASVVEALLASGPELRRGSSTFVVGLWTHAHGWVHTGTLAWNFTGWLPDTTVELEASGLCNPLTEEQRAGPYFGSNHMPSRTPTALPTVPWPLER